MTVGATRNLQMAKGVHVMKHYSTTHTHLSGDRVAVTRKVTVNGYRTEPHEHDEYMFLLPRTGLLILNVESNPAPLRIPPMSFVAVPSRRFHDTHSTCATQEHIAVYVAADFVAFCEDKAERKLTRDTLAIRSVPWSLMNAVRLTNLERLSGSSAGELAEYRSDLTDRMIATACIETSLNSRPVMTHAADTRSELVEDIKAFLDATLAQRLDIDRIAHEFGLSRRSLTRMFRDMTGDSIVEYQSRQRVRQAAAMLRSSGTTVVTAAAAVGFESPSYLARLFTKYGEPLPGRFKR
jgi:AraC-like DNA-binding protein